MPRFTGPQHPGLQAPVGTVSRDVAEPDTTTHEGGSGYGREARSNLFLLAVQNFVAQKTFYERGEVRDRRFISLAQAVAQEPDGPGWLARFVPYLRNTCNMRTAPVVLAVEAARVIGGGTPGSRELRARLVDSACARADEPLEALGYYMATNVRPRVLPNWLRVGLGRAAVRLFDEFAVLQYDGGSRGVRMADVLELAHLPTVVPGVRDQDAENVEGVVARHRHDLFKYVLDRRHNHDEHVPESLTMIRENRALHAVPITQRRGLLMDDDFITILGRAGMKWNDVAGWLQGPLDRTAWEAVIPRMGYQALLKNLRNFDEVGVSDAVADRVAVKLADPERVRRAQLFPYSFVTAAKAVANLRWSYPLERALQASLANVPRLAGSTLIMVDCSGSMNPEMTGRDDRGLSRAEVAGIFGAALALRADRATLVGYGDQLKRVPVPRGGSVLPLAREFDVNLGGTRTFEFLSQLYDDHDRVVIITDEQAFAIGSDAWQQYGYGSTLEGTLRTAADLERVVAHVRCPIYTWNIGGEEPAHLPSGGRRFTFGGLTDASFLAISQLEAHRGVDWPF